MATPRTDALTATPVKIAGFQMIVHTTIVPAAFARTLELEIQGLKKLLDLKNKEDKHE